jgi:FAD/FMN-containing dehydrogenase
MDPVVSDLVDELRGQGISVLTAANGESYHSARCVWNGDIDRTPSAIVACLNTFDVASTVKACARRKLPVVTVRGGGHNVAGHAVANDVVMIDVCDRTVVVSDDRRTVAVGGGALWADVEAATAPLGMHVPGIVIGCLARTYGLLEVGVGLGLTLTSWRWD